MSISKKDFDSAIDIVKEIRSLHKAIENSYINLWTKLEIEVSFQVDELINKRGIKRKDLAQKMGTSAAYITKILRGDANFTLETLAKLAHALDADINISIREKKPGNIISLSSCKKNLEKNNDFSVVLKSYDEADNASFGTTTTTNGVGNDYVTTSA